MTGELPWGQRLAARVLLAEPFSAPAINAERVSAALGLTPAQGRVAAGGTVASIAAATHRPEAAIRWHIREALSRLGLARQVDLVRVVLFSRASSTTENEAAASRLRLTLAWKYASAEEGNANTSLRVSGRGSFPG